MSSDSEYSPSSRGKDMDECSLDSLARNHESVLKGNVERSSFELDEPSTNIWFEVENNTQWFDQHHHIRQRFLDGQVDIHIHLLLFHPLIIVIIYVPLFS
ncbi:hypothetical protein AMTRI_Chr08g210350 [Amborella trichopoda]